jgi:hypothetical protein
MSSDTLVVQDALGEKVSHLFSYRVHRPAKKCKIMQYIFSKMDGGH